MFTDTDNLMYETETDENVYGDFSQNKIIVNFRICWSKDKTVLDSSEQL